MGQYIVISKQFERLRSQADKIHNCIYKYVTFLSRATRNQIFFLLSLVRIIIRDHLDFFLRVKVLGLHLYDFERHASLTTRCVAHNDNKISLSAILSLKLIHYLFPRFLIFNFF